MDRGMLASLALASLLLGACGGGSDSPPPQPTPTPPAAPTPTPTPTPPPGPVVLAKQRAYPSLTFMGAVALLRAANDSSRWFVATQDGRVVSFTDVENAATTTTVVDLSQEVTFHNVSGLLGLAFHPSFPSDPRAYVAYTHQRNGVTVLRVSELKTADNGITLNPASEQIIFELEQPGGHNNGGHVLFGPDGFLYLGIGDGGDDDDPSGVVGNGQTTTNLLGKILRLDVSGAAPGLRYRIPTDNPFAGNTPCGRSGAGAQNCPEIFAWGFRNPWRWSFDRQGGQLWLGDVGSHDREEIDRVTKGGNYGWRCMEGTRATMLSCGSPSTPLAAPVAEYDHTLGVAVTGGFVYRGSAIPGLVGRYVFGDYGSGRVWHIAADTQPTMTMQGTDAFDSGTNLASFTEDTNGELLIIDVKSGALYRLIAG